MTSFSDDMRQRRRRPDSRLLSFTEEAAGAELGARLKISPVDRTWAIRRLRLAHDETMAIEFLHVPQRIAPGLTRRDLEGHSFYDLLFRRYGISVAAGTQTIKQRSPTTRRPRSSVCRCTRRPSSSNEPARATRGRWWSSSGRSIEETDTGS